MTDSHILRTQDCYAPIGESTVIQKYFEENRDNLNFEIYFNFEISAVPLDVILSEPILANINKKFKIKAGGISKIRPFRCYNWHVDDHRGASINLLLTPQSKSLMFFGQTSIESSEQLDFIELVYMPRTFYLFNNQIKHSVINFNDTRYLFTLEFEQDKNLLNFDKVLKCLFSSVG